MSNPEDKIAEYLKLVQRLREEAEKLGLTVSIQIALSIPSAIMVQGHPVEPKLPTKDVVEKPMEPKIEHSTVVSKIVEQLAQKYPMHSKEKILALISEELAKSAGMLTFEAAAGIVDKNLGEQYVVVKKPAPIVPQPPKPIRNAATVIAELKTAISGMDYDETSFTYEDEKTVVNVKARGWIEKWSDLNRVLRDDFEAKWVTERGVGRWVIPV